MLNHRSQESISAPALLLHVCEQIKGMHNVSLVYAHSDIGVRNNNTGNDSSGYISVAGQEYTVNYVRGHGNR